jgi:hypothetical protein
MNDSDSPVDVRTRFDQFPATIKGAFVMRGADGNPHAVDIQDCSIQRLPSGPGKTVSLGDVRVNVAPIRDLFVPFEVGIAELEPGWYAVRSNIRVDAGRTWTFASRAFAVPWPREQVRRGALKVGRTVRAGGEAVLIEGIDMRVDCTVVTWRSEVSSGRKPARAVGSPAVLPRPPRLSADGVDLEALPAEARPAGGRPDPGGASRAVFYPVPKGTRSLRLVVTGSSGAESQPVEIPLG